MRFLEDRQGSVEEERHGTEERRGSLGAAVVSSNGINYASRLVEDFENVQRHSPALKSVSANPEGYLNNHTNLLCLSLWTSLM